MNTVTFLAFVGLLALLLFLNRGISPATVTVVLVAAALAAIPWYFGTRDHTAEPGRFERFLATLWEWFRRTIGFSAGALCLWVGWNIATSRFSADGVANSWLAAGGVAAFGLVLIYFGAVGQGSNRADWRDDVALHSNNKRRYKWWF